MYLGNMSDTSRRWFQNIFEFFTSKAFLDDYSGPLIAFGRSLPQARPSSRVWTVKYLECETEVLRVVQRRMKTSPGWSGNRGFPTKSVIAEKVVPTKCWGMERKKERKRERERWRERERKRERENERTRERENEKTRERENERTREREKERKRGREEERKRGREKERKREREKERKREREKAEKDRERQRKREREKQRKV